MPPPLAGLDKGQATSPCPPHRQIRAGPHPLPLHGWIRVESCLLSPCGARPGPLLTHGWIRGQLPLAPSVQLDGAPLHLMWVPDRDYQLYPACRWTGHWPSGPPSKTFEHHCNKAQWIHDSKYKYYSDITNIKNLTNILAESFLFTQIKLKWYGLRLPCILFMEYVFFLLSRKLI